MTIGIDIDDTITNTSILNIEHAMSVFNKTYDEAKVFIYNSKIEDKLEDYYYKYLPELFLNYEIKDNAKEVIDRLRKKGYRIVLITARGHTINLEVEEFTKRYLEEKEIKVDDVICRQHDKTSACLENNIDIMIDDSLFVLNKLVDAKIRLLLFTSDRNKDINTSIDRVDNWLEIEKYIENIGEKNEE